MMSAQPAPIEIVVKQRGARKTTSTTVRLPALYLTKLSRGDYLDSYLRILLQEAVLKGTISQQTLNTSRLFKT